jgi:hypothetical protein
MKRRSIGKNQSIDRKKAGGEKETTISSSYTSRSKGLMIAKDPLYFHHQYNIISHQTTNNETNHDGNNRRRWFHQH